MLLKDDSCFYMEEEAVFEEIKVSSYQISKHEAKKTVFKIYADYRLTLEEYIEMNEDCKKALKFIGNLLRYSEILLNTGFMIKNMTIDHIYVEEIKTDLIPQFAASTNLTLKGTHRSIGTDHFYAAPETLNLRCNISTQMLERDEYREYDVKANIYSLGIILARILVRILARILALNTKFNSERFEIGEACGLEVYYDIIKNMTSFVPEERSLRKKGSKESTQIPSVIPPNWLSFRLSQVQIPEWEKYSLTSIKKISREQVKGLPVFSENLKYLHKLMGVINSIPCNPEIFDSNIAEGLSSRYEISPYQEKMSQQNILDGRASFASTQRDDTYEPHIVPGYKSQQDSLSIAAAHNESDEQPMVDDYKPYACNKNNEKIVVEMDHYERYTHLFENMNTIQSQLNEKVKQIVEKDDLPFEEKQKQIQETKASYCFDEIAMYITP